MAFANQGESEHILRRRTIRIPPSNFCASVRAKPFAWLGHFTEQAHQIRSQMQRTLADLYDFGHAAGFSYVVIADRQGILDPNEACC
jgi:hypothetical protein